MAILVWDFDNTLAYRNGMWTRHYMIGDSYLADVQGALKCGLEAILVRQENIHNYSKHSIDLDGIWEYIKE